MTPDISQLIQECDWGLSTYLFFSTNVFDPLIYYSHLAVLIPVVLVGVFVFLNGRRRLPNILLLITTSLFALWIASDSILWATEYPSYTMFFWTLEIIIEPLIYFFAFYFFCALVFGKDLPLRWKVLFVLPVLPTLVLASTRLGLLGYNLTACDRDAYEGILTIYGYGIEVLYVLMIVCAAIFAWHRAQKRRDKTQILFLAVGITAFLVTLSFGNIVGVFSDDWSYGQYGLFGAPVFAALLAYVIVRFQAFNIKLIGAQALVIALVVLIGCQFFFIQSNTNRILTAITLIITGVIGVNLIRSVKKEVAQREHIEQLAKELEATNERQETLIHFIGHEVKGFLTKAEGAFAALCEGDFGELPEGLKPFVRESLKQTREGVTSVSDILQSANQKKGTVTYKKEPFDLAALMIEMVARARSAAEAKKLTLTLHLNESVRHPFIGDKEQIAEHVLRNLIDNAVAYTPSGSIDISLTKEGGRYVISVKDTGIGISAEDKQHLFTEGGHGKESQKVNVHSTGYGLFIAKAVVEAHGGTIRVESEGAGKGSTFIVALPVPSAVEGPAAG